MPLYRGPGRQDHVRTAPPTGASAPTTSCTSASMPASAASLHAPASPLPPPPLLGCAAGSAISAPASCPSTATSDEVPDALRLLIHADEASPVSFSCSWKTASTAGRGAADCCGLPSGPGDVLGASAGAGAPGMPPAPLPSGATECIATCRRTCVVTSYAAPRASHTPAPLPAAPAAAAGAAPKRCSTYAIRTSSSSAWQLLDSPDNGTEAVAHE
eukprot:363781-Chlamydomonas_euryale.AAC.9